MGTTHVASESRPFEQVVASVSGYERWVKTIFARLDRVALIPPHAKVLDVGASAGGFVAACNRLGYQCEGVEPWEEARRNSAKLGEHLRIPIRVVNGVAESIPFEANTFDVVHAASVLEHVRDVEQAVQEAHRVLKPGGVFWFSAQSAMCPWQNEIRGFPLFGWYPNGLKIHIMQWVKDARPQLVGYTRAPAINWFTPGTARALLRRHGFREIHDRWDLRREEEGGQSYRVVLRTIKLSTLTKVLADVVVPGCAYAAVK